MTPLPKAVCDAARRMSEDPTLLELIRADWPYLEIAAQADRFFGQEANAPSKGDRDALKAMQTLIEWAGSDGCYARGFAPYLAAHGESSAALEERIAQALGTMQRLEAVLARQATMRGKQKKRFLPLLAECVCVWHRALHLSPPALSSLPDSATEQEIG